LNQARRGRALSRHNPILYRVFHSFPLAIFKCVQTSDQGWITEGTLYPSRAIYINFKRHYDPQSGFPYFLFGMEYLSDEVKEEEIHLNIKLQLPDTVPDETTFSNWVFQSINQSAKRLHDRILLENIMASSLEAAYLSISPFVFQLLQQTIPLKENI